MKTPMQELMTQLAEDYPELFSTRTKKGREFIDRYHLFLKKERRVMVDLLNLDLKTLNPPMDGAEYYRYNYQKPIG